METFDHVLGNREIDQVSPMFISDHANAWDAKQTLQILFFNNPNKFFCDPKVFFLSMCIPLLEYLLEEIYALSVGSFSKTPAGNRASSENCSKESSKEV